MCWTQQSSNWRLKYCKAAPDTGTGVNLICYSHAVHAAAHEFPWLQWPCVLLYLREWEHRRIGRTYCVPLDTLSTFTRTYICVNVRTSVSALRREAGRGLGKGRSIRATPIRPALMVSVCWCVLTSAAICRTNSLPIHGTVTVPVLVVADIGNIVVCTLCCVLHGVHFVTRLQRHYML